MKEAYEIKLCRNWGDQEMEIVNKKIKVAGIQLGSYIGSYDENMKRIIGLAKKVKDTENPDLIVCSELMTAPYFAAVPETDDQFFDYAEFMDGPTVSTMIDLARSTNIHIVGTLFEKEWAGESLNYYNTAFVCSPTRGLIGSYRKVHVPRVDVASMKTDEKYYFERLGGGGKEFPVFTLDNGFRIGILICFDRSFPEAWRALAVQSVDLVVVPTATYGFRKELYVEELRVRALENNLFVLGVNKAGFECLPKEVVPRQHFGLSCLIDPYGEKIAVTSEEEWSFVSGEIDLEQTVQSKQRVNFLEERKEEIYNKYLLKDHAVSKQ